MDSRQIAVFWKSYRCDLNLQRACKAADVDPFQIQAEMKSNERFSHAVSHLQAAELNIAATAGKEYEI